MPWPDDVTPPGREGRTRDRLPGGRPPASGRYRPRRPSPPRAPPPAQPGALRLRALERRGRRVHGRLELPEQSPRVGRVRRARARGAPEPVGRLPQLVHGAREEPHRLLVPRLGPEPGEVLALGRREPGELLRAGQVAEAALEPRRIAALDLLASPPRDEI